MTRVAAYCRVSTDKRDQQNSFESQKQFFTSYISANTNWVLADIYADEGITGTSALSRAGFLKMMDDAYRHRFDLLLTKEVSRFSRNIFDAVYYTRELKKIGIGVLFLNDGIMTLDADAELRLGIMASFAQEESRKTSERVKWGQQRMMERGVVFGRSLLGYNVKNGKITVEPEGADIVRRIFRLYILEGLGVRAIAKTLTAEGIPTQTGKNVWSGASVLKILRNEKYCGDLRQRKTVTTDYLTHQKIKNDVEADHIFIENHHEPIVSREEWNAAQAELFNRAAPIRKNKAHGNRYALSGKILCGVCYAVFFCRTRKRKDGTRYRVWQRPAVCRHAQKSLREELLAQCIRRFVASIDRDALTGNLNRILEKITLPQSSGKALKSSVLQLEQKKIKLIDAYLKAEITRSEYLYMKNKYESELNSLNAKLSVNTMTADNADAAARAVMIDALVSGTDAGDAFYLGLVSKILVLQNGALEVGIKYLPDTWTICFKNN